MWGTVALSRGPPGEEVQACASIGWHSGWHSCSRDGAHVGGPDARQRPIRKGLPQPYARSTPATPAATALTDCSPVRCYPLTGTCQPPRILPSGLVPTGARRSTPRRKSEQDMHRRDGGSPDGTRCEALVGPQRAWSCGSRPASGGNSPSGNLPELLANTVAPHTGPVGPRHTPPPDPANDRPAASGTLPLASIRAP
jgi:hypothetical protein